VYVKGPKERFASIFSVWRALAPSTAHGLSSGFSLSYISTAFAPRGFLYTLKKAAAGSCETSTPFYKAKERHTPADSYFSV
jgi:hypothetical protein